MKYAKIPPQAVAFPNKYPGKCTFCGKRVEAYSGFCYKHYSGKYIASHHECGMSDEQIALEKASKEAARILQQEAQFAREQELALAKDLRDAALAKCAATLADTKLQQHAYSDVCIQKFFFNPAATDEDIRLAYEVAPEGSLATSLRCSGGSKVTKIVRTSGGDYFELTSTTILAD